MKLKIFKGKEVPRWVIQLIDFIIISWSFTLSYFIIKHFEFPEIYRGHFFIYTGLYCIIATVVFYFMRIHTGLIRYSNTQDIFRIFFAIIVTSLIYPLVTTPITSYLNIHSLNIFSVLLLNFFINSSLLIMLRTAVKETFLFARRIESNSKQRVIIFGSNDGAVLLKNAIESSKLESFVIVGFIESNLKKAYTYIEQKKIYHLRDLKALKEKHKVEKLIIENEDLGNAEKKHIIELCLKIGIKVVTVPPSDQWVYGKLSLKQIKDLNIEDLLQREPIVINNNLIANELFQKRILITGAAGSIGSEIVRQVLLYKPELVVLCDQAESALHDMQLEIEEKYPAANIKIFIGNIKNYKRMQILFTEFQPHIVFHAAAYKHVPMMENNPSEAVLNNIMGTKIVADLALINEVDKFVMISTDKAVNPTNVMGGSKRIAEMYTQSLNGKDDNFYEVGTGSDTRHISAKNVKTKFITTRFGNVLDSNGSVIPRFRAQIQKGGPVTVTDPEITRFFMTIPEAVQLVLEAGTMGKGGEIYVFDMGKPVKIAKLATQMITLAGLVPDIDIKIVYTGLRPGEKLYEELLNEKETTLPTHHEKIKIAKVITHSHEEVLQHIEELILMSHHDDDHRIVKKMKDMVPEFISNNSRFEHLDKLTIIDGTAPAKKLHDKFKIVSDQ